MRPVLKPYPEYKDAELSWLQRIPINWTERRAKTLLREVDERSSTGDEELLSVSHLTGVTPRSQKTVTMFMAESNIGHKLCRPGDLVINTMWAWMAALGVAKHTGLVSPAYGVYRPFGKAQLFPDYVDYLLRSQPYASEYFCRSTGIRTSRLRLYPDKFLEIPILCPPSEDQQAILAFIRNSERQFRLFVQAKRRLIELLNEQKMIVLREVITRGIRPGVRLRPTGISWLGNIPEGWQLLKLRHLVSQCGGMTPSKADPRYWDGVIPWVSPKDMKVDRLGDSEDHISEVALRESNITLIPPPAILIVVRGMILARTFPVTLTTTTVTINQDMKALLPGKQLHPRYLYYLIKGLSSHILTLTETSGHGTRCLRTDQWLNLPLPIPNPDEQLEIVEFLAKELEGINEGIASTQQEIAYVREYRSRFITDVVTGKLDVRDAIEHPHSSVEYDVVTAEADCLESDDLEDTDESHLEVFDED